MPSIPVDVLQEILEHVDKSDLATLCRVNKTCCSCSQNVLYREIYDGNERVIQTLAQSTDLARRVRLFHAASKCPELAMALRNMLSLSRLKLTYATFNGDASVLDGCTFKLDSFETNLRYSESLQKFLNSQSSLTKFEIYNSAGRPPPFEETFLPNLTRVRASPSWVSMLIPGRSMSVVMVIDPWGEDPIDISIFTLSTAPIWKLHLNYRVIYPTPGSYLASIFPSLEQLIIDSYDAYWGVRIHYICLFNRVLMPTIIGYVGL
jgi:F-box-like